MALANDQLLAHLEREIDLLIAEARVADTSAPVQSTPGWNVTELLSHVEWVYRVVLSFVRDGGDSALPPKNFWPEEVVGEIESRSAELFGVLAKADPNAPAWNWTGDNRAGWWVRRMVHETRIHRLDLQLVTSAVAVTDPELARDGIDELISTYLVGRELWQQLPAPSSIAIRANDTDDDWHIAVGEGVEITQDERLADLKIEGTAADVELALWGRADATAVRVEGDQDLWATWRAISW